MVDNKLLSKLSQNLLEVLNDEEYYDITIEVGNDPYIKIFRAHIVILNYRSPYLKRILSTNKKKNDGTLTHVKLSNVSPEIFQVILRYIYGGRIPLEECDTSDIIKILDAANILSLQELIIYLQSFLIENKTKWMEENFDLIYRTSFENNTFLELQKYCTDLISKEPAKIFKSPNISSIPEKLLISIIQNDYLQMNEVQIWDQLIKWGLAQHPELPSDFTNYSKNDFKTLKNTIQQCIPFIRFYNLSSKEFTDNVLPYRKLLPKELYEDLLKTFLTLSDPNSKPENKSRPRIINDIKLSLPNYENVSDQVENNKSMVNMTSYNWKVTEEDSKKREELRKSKEILKEKLNKLRHSMLKNPTEEQSKWWEVVTEEPKKWDEPTEEQNNWLEEEPKKWEEPTKEQNEWWEPTEKWVKSAKSSNEKWVKPFKSPNEKWVKSAKNPNEKWVKSAKNPNEKWVSTKKWVKPTVEKPKRGVEPTEKSKTLVEETWW
ncbi:uncharacterized protein OCT59_014147 [Rhizophagus irregularis]|uniref:BTB domain-containing protein n=3 Tax=Rhizophagus irregularis TaxID=588596 RepID=A0A015J3G6_RHIIW|nr:hypothetical protein GLOIN_2v1592460 [Rhizophagus irregularis DAOM 181602=DAOM 197198]EXX64022.1 hypothetical protein RirG_146770 [Rhizophagus irregularis DAOM 197198w]POG72822.1 hypothetical protein GLOIN_2v1592460 [Rhizophagus irregularis DAOM 181602=DAOM 197198]UZO21762.1 hypothetical protein OCT59_014147 [Rhizophagus irregularis]|eukprot:XP_025179688.1 hypothetical protein GLOIN_2v1592460 [Rhizophagus irregularis DAOM 181602=DAOM 197198]